MKERVRKSKKESAARLALRRRVMQWYERFNSERWSECLALVDPKLTAGGRVVKEAYAKSLEVFKRHYGAVHPWHVRISLHLSTARSASDPRPFAYVYTVWQDDRHGFHMFRERWVRDGDKWYTRVAGLVVNDKELSQAG
jgi:hypothetical protein